tara:strand:- start:48 stop:320 length:273 start_codon:yes stop_codon:yes gene_type:complete
MNNELNIDQHKKEKITISIDKDGNKDEMSYYELSRWYSLIEAIEYIDKKATQLGMAKSDGSWVKPIALQKYIDERTPSMLFDMVNNDDTD